MVDQQLPPPTLPASAATQNSATTELIHLTYHGNFQLDTEATVLLCRVIDVSNDMNPIHSTAYACDNDDDHQQHQQQQQKRMEGTMDIPIELQLDITTMHPQGGGQPTDIGSIAMVNTDRNSIDEEEIFADSSIVANIEKVTIDRKTGIVTHAGTVSVSPKKKNNNAQNLSSIIFPPNSRVKVCVHPYNRRLLSECHTAGHVVDAAMSKCGKIMKPIKGYHFLDGPYVEYQGSIDANEREEFLSTLQSAYQVSCLLPLVGINRSGLMHATVPLNSIISNKLAGDCLTKYILPCMCRN